MVAEEIVNGSLRRRKNDTKVEQVSNETSVKEEVVWGKTPGGIVFRVPTTHDVLTTLFHPLHQKSYLDLLSLSTLALQLFLFFVLPKRAAQIFFLFYVALWRAAYDAGLGWILTKQSKKKWIVREVQRRGWLDENRRPAVRAWIRNELAGKMGKDYNFDDLPLEYNTWLLFRQAVDIILINDFLAYVLFAFTCFRVPENLSLLVHILRWIGGITLIAFNIWVKMEAHHIVKDYGWYWGDVFFERGALVFDGVFEMAPHPMYSVGYAGYYGLSMIAGSYPVLFVSLAIHAAQFGFLVCFENPHIERMYGQRKPIALRTPLFSNRNRALSQSSTTSSAVASTGVSAESSQSISSILEIATAESSKARPQTRNRRHHKASFSISSSVEGSTPAITDAGSSLDAETEVETELDEDEVLDANGGSSSGGTIDAGGPPSKMKSRTAQRLATITQYDLMNKYFRKDVVGLKNIDLLRASDLKLLLAISYTLFNSFIGGSLTHKQGLVLHFLHAFGWRMFHSFGLGLLLKRQSESKFLVRHFVKNYYYPPGTAAEGAVEEAFSNWKSMYNLSLWMTYGSFIGLAWRTYQAPSSFSDLMTGDLLLRHTLGVMMIALHVWTALECYEVLGVFGWFFGDFFIEDYPSQLDYTVRK
ncbi:phosphatidylethanolamine N-methyltransferase [Tulasnella sp. 419]|nr:phosphatidylethanolamine N-methyltransferase [Tulasnella sp. 419]